MSTLVAVTFAGEAEFGYPRKAHLWLLGDAPSREADV